MISSIVIIITLVTCAKNSAWPCAHIRENTYLSWTTAHIPIHRLQRLSLFLPLYLYFTVMSFFFSGTSSSTSTLAFFSGGLFHGCSSPLPSTT